MRRKRYIVQAQLSTASLSAFNKEVTKALPAITPTPCDEKLKERFWLSHCHETLSGGEDLLLALRGKERARTGLRERAIKRSLKGYKN